MQEANVELWGDRTYIRTTSHSLSYQPLVIVGVFSEAGMKAEISSYIRCAEMANIRLLNTKISDYCICDCLGKVLPSIAQFGHIACSVNESCFY